MKSPGARRSMRAAAPVVEHFRAAGGSPEGKLTMVDRIDLTQWIALAAASSAGERRAALRRAARARHRRALGPSRRCRPRSRRRASRSSWARRPSWYGRAARGQDPRGGSTRWDTVHTHVHPHFPPARRSPMSGLRRRPPSGRSPRASSAVARRDESLREGRHARGREHLARAVLELLVSTLGGTSASAGSCGSFRVRAPVGGDRRGRGVRRARRAAPARS